MMDLKSFSPSGLFNNHIISYHFLHKKAMDNQQQQQQQRRRQRLLLERQQQKQKQKQPLNFTAAILTT